MQTKWLRAILAGIAIFLAWSLVWPALNGKSPLRPGLDISGGVIVRYQPDFSRKLETYKNLSDYELLALCKDVLQSRLYTKLKITPDIVIRRDNSILVSIPNVQNPSQVLDIVGRTYYLTMNLVLGEYEKPSKNLYPYGGRYLLLQEPKFSGDMLDLSSIKVKFAENKPEVAFAFTSPYDIQFENFTKQHLNKKLAILIDDRVVMAPVIKSVITSGEGTISGDYTDEEARDTAMLLRSGSLPVSLQIENIQTIGPTLGHEVEESGLRALILSLILLLSVIAVSYLQRVWFLFAGIVAFFCLIFSIVGFAAAFDLTVDIAAIAGIVLTLGMGMDAFIIIFESLENKLSRFTPADISRHYRFIIKSIYSFRSEGRVLLHANITTVIVLLPLVYSERLKFFALFIVVGVMASIYTILITRETLYATNAISSKTGLSLMGWLRWKRVDIFRFRFFYIIGCCIAGALALGFVGLSLLGKGYLQFGPDFQSGTQIVAQFDKSSEISSLLRVIKEKFPGISVKIQEIKGVSEYSQSKEFKRVLLSLNASFTDIIGKNGDLQNRSTLPNELSSKNGRRLDDNTFEKLSQGSIDRQNAIDETSISQNISSGTLLNIFLENNFQILSFDSVSSRLSAHRLMSSISVIFISFFLLVLYLLFFQKRIDSVLFDLGTRDDAVSGQRPISQFWPSLGIIIAVMNDVAFVILGCSLLKISISLPVIAGILTIVGYSVNDSIVVLSHIQNRTSAHSGPRSKKESVEIVSKSIDSVLSRAVFTSLTTIIPGVAILLTGLKDLGDFASVIIIGVISGTLSSLFIVGTFTVQSLTTLVPKVKITRVAEEGRVMTLDEVKKHMTDSS